jgi:hypothetical protein
MSFDVTQPVWTAELFRDHVDLLGLVYDFDPMLPELVELKENAAFIVDDPVKPLRYLKALNPALAIMMIDRVPAVKPRMFGPCVLKTWTVARSHVAYLDDRVNLVVADALGVTLYEDSIPLITFPIAAIEPYRFDDDGVRYMNACAIIKEFTKLDLDWKDHIGRTARLIVTRTRDDWELTTELASTV